MQADKRLGEILGVCGAGFQGFSLNRHWACHSTRWGHRCQSWLAQLNLAEVGASLSVSQAGLEGQFLETGTSVRAVIRCLSGFRALSLGGGE